MTVKSMSQRLEQYASEHLGRVVPEDVVIVYDVATVIQPVVCEDGHVHPETKVRVHLYAEFPRPRSKTCISSSLEMPFDFVSDGDLQPMAHVLDTLWEHLRFLNITGDVMPDIYRVVMEQGDEGTP